MNFSPSDKTILYLKNLKEDLCSSKMAPTPHIKTAAELTIKQLIEQVKSNSEYDPLVIY